MKNLSLVVFTILVVFMACTPKTVEKVTTTPEVVAETPVAPDKDKSPCKNWIGPNEDVLVRAHVIYKDRLREIRNLVAEGQTSATTLNGKWDEAFNNWIVAYKGAPAADGERPDHFEDGAEIYQHYYDIATTAAEKNSFVDSIMILYDERARCYGQEAYITGAKAFDYYYKYQNLKSELEIYKLFAKSMDLYQENADYFVLNPFTGLLANLLVNDKIPMAEAQKYVKLILASLKNGLAKANTPRLKEPWKIVNDYVPARLAQLEGVKGFYDCDYYKDKYFAEWEANQADCNLTSSIIGRLKYGGCSDVDQAIVKARAAFKQNCKIEVPGPSAGPSCRSLLENGDFNGAIDCYSGKAESSSDPEKRAQYNLIVAKLYYGELKRYAKARTYAYRALKDKPKWGDPYMLIGKLYASSGPLCGPGRGWDSQIVTWPAIDKWKKAKSVDPSVASEANRLISKYQKYMPSKEDIFIRTLKAGDSFTVKCWIQEKTIIRPAQ